MEQVLRSSGAFRSEGESGKAVHEQESFPPPDPADIFRFTFQDLPPNSRSRWSVFSKRTASHT